MLARGGVMMLALVAMAAIALGEDDGMGDFFKKHGKKRELKTCHGDTRFNKKWGKAVCQHLGFRFCMRLITDEGKPYLFGDRASENSTEQEEDLNGDGLDWWEWSTQPQHKDSWLKGIVDTGGTHWCSCALCTSEAVDRFGCDNLDIQCDATDMAFIRYRVEHDKHMVLKSGLECLEKKCGKDYQKDWPVKGHDCKHRGCARLYGTGYEHSLMPLAEDGRAMPVTMGFAAATFAVFLGSIALALRMRRASAPQPPLLTVEAEELSEVDVE